MGNIFSTINEINRLKSSYPPVPFFVINDLLDNWLILSIKLCLYSNCFAKCTNWPNLLFLLVLKYFLIFFGVRVLFQSSWNAIEFHTIKHPFSVLSAFMSAFVWTTFRTWKMTTRTFVVHTITEILFAKFHDSLFVVDVHVFAWKIIREVMHTTWKIHEINNGNSQCGKIL